MSQNNASITYTAQEVIPVFPGDQIIERELVFKPNLTIKAGTVLGQVSAASASQVQTLDWSGSGNVPSGGTFTLSIANVDGGTSTTDALAYNISNANLKIAIEALLTAAGYTGATVTIGGGACPVDVTVTFGGTAASWDMPVMTADITSITSSGTATLTISATTPGSQINLWGPYADTDSTTGLGTARAIARYNFRTDHLGRVIFTSVGATPQWGNYKTTAPAWFSGVFKTSELVGLDAAGVADLGRLWSGTVADGLLSLK